MDAISTYPDPLEVVMALNAAVNAHDLDALTKLFAEDYRNETPAHPFRGFTGRAQVRRNWDTMFSGVLDVTMEVLGAAAAADRVWVELRMAGTRRDGSPHDLAGVCIFTVSEGEIIAARFYLEPVERASGDVDQAVRRQMSGGAP